MKRIIHIVGARPNFMKIAPVMREMAKFPEEFEQILVHTGQHYDPQMSQVFFEELKMPRPNLNLKVGGGSHATQTAQVMLGFEPVLLDFKPDWILVPGDVNSTLACALTASKLGIKIAHVEAGLRSFDRTMPEEINRILTDHLSDLLLTTEPSARNNLRQEGIPDEKVRFVGNVMIDMLVQLLPSAEAHWPFLQEHLKLDRYVLVTLHRPSNVDDPATLGEILEALRQISRQIPVVFPVHPRTRKRMNDLGFSVNGSEIHLLEPAGYLDFLALQSRANLVITDSGGVQEETTYLGIPCLTARANTERPVTITQGTNRLVGGRSTELVQATLSYLQESPPGPSRSPKRPELWDGQTAGRIVAELRKEMA